MISDWLHSKRMKYISFAVLLFLLMGGIYVYTHRGGQGVKKAEVRPTVKVVTLVRQDMMKRIVLSGETVPKASVDISPKYAGRIAEVAVDLGDAVSLGDVLLRQDTKDVSISIGENRAGSAQAAAEAVTSRAEYDAGTMKAQSDYENALTTYERYQQLFDEGAVSRQDRDDRYRAMMEAKAALEGLTSQSVGGRPAVIVGKEAAAEKARYAVEALTNQQADMTLLSPLSGIVSYRRAEAGEWATAGEKLLTVVDTSELYLDCQVAEQDVGILQEGMSLDVSIDSLGESVKGTIRYISPAMDADTHAYKVRLVLTDPAAQIRGGMFGRTEVTAMQKKDVLLLPKTAVIDHNGKKLVYVVDEDGRAEEVPVTLGVSNDEMVEIRSGLAAGERAAVTNLSKLKNGMVVEVKD